MEKTFDVELGERLAKKLERKAIATRSEGSGEFKREYFYLNGWYVIERANELFGFDGWSLRVLDLQSLDKEERNGKCEVFYRATVRLTVHGIVRDEVGYGNGIDKRGYGHASELAIKECVTDAMKRAFRTFGNQFGNCLYDKDKAGVEDRKENPKPAPPKEAPLKEVDPEELGANTGNLDNDAYYHWLRQVQGHKTRVGEELYYAILGTHGYEKANQVQPGNSHAMNLILVSLQGTGDKEKKT